MQILLTAYNSNTTFVKVKFYGIEIIIRIITYSNTTFVKVKLRPTTDAVRKINNSNTTFVKVKSGTNRTHQRFFCIQIQHLLKLN